MVYASCAYYMARWMQEADLKINPMNVDYNESDMGNAELKNYRGTSPMLFT